MKRRLKKFFLTGSLAFAICTAIIEGKSRIELTYPCSSNDSASISRRRVARDNAAIRGKILGKTRVVAGKIVASDATVGTGKTNFVAGQYMRKPVMKVNLVCGYEASWTPDYPIEKGSDTAICGRHIPINLSDHKTWPTPYTPSMGGTVDWDSKEVVFVKKGHHYGGLGSTLNAFFHTYDFAFDTKRPLYIGKEAWALEALFRLFFGPEQAVRKDAKLWGIVEETLGMRVIEDEPAVGQSGLSVPKFLRATEYFYYRTSAIEAEKIRDHRNTIFRQLFKYPAQQGANNVCSIVDTVSGNDKKKHYAVVWIASKTEQSYLAHLNENTGRDHTVANQMSPEYVKNILKQTDAMEKDIYLVHPDPEAADSIIHGRLARDAELKDYVKSVPYEYSGCLGSNIYFSVLADLYIGSPVDQLSVWIARMRIALGMKDNTYVFTEKKGDNWVSYVDADNLYLYNHTELANWMA